MTREEKLALVDSLIDRDAARWKQWVRDSDSGLAEMLSRRNHNFVIMPPQR